jgi:uncharacterized linocin/CFP29 family protein
MNNTNEVNWDDPTWKAITDAVTSEVSAVRTAQKVFPGNLLSNNPTSVTDDKINTEDFSIEEGLTKPIMEIYIEFSLTGSQVANESTLNTCQTLATMTAKELALAEDQIILQGNRAKLSDKIKVVHKKYAGDGLLGEASEIKGQHEVGRKAAIKNGGQIYALLQKGIEYLKNHQQAPEFALFVPMDIYADTCIPLLDSSMSTTADLINQNVKGGYYGTGAVPDNTGLLVALGGGPISIYIAEDATVEFIRQDGNRFIFRVVERIQYVVRDKRALVKLNFDNG